MSVIELPESLPVPQKWIKQSFMLQSKDVAVKIPNGKQRELVEQWLKDGVDVHLSTVVCIDEMDRFELLYFFMNRETNETLAVYVDVDRENPIAPSIHDLIGSTLYEGEITEMFGVVFEGNTLDQVFLPENWEFGFPLRKDWVDPREKEVTES